MAVVGETTAKLDKQTPTALTTSNPSTRKPKPQPPAQQPRTSSPTPVAPMDKDQLYAKLSPFARARLRDATLADKVVALILWKFPVQMVSQWVATPTHLESMVDQVAAAIQQKIAQENEAAPTTTALGAQGVKQEAASSSNNRPKREAKKKKKKEKGAQRG